MAIPEWLTLSQLSGSGDTVITITASTYDEFVERTSSLTISGNTKSVTVPIVQDGVDLTSEYLTFVVSEGGTIAWYKSYNGMQNKPIEYSINNGSWTTINPSTAGTVINVSSGDKVRFRGDNSAYSESNYFTRFGGTAKYSLMGNIMSLIDSDDFSDVVTFSGNGNFLRLFSGCTSLTDASMLSLPATAVTTSCYASMFRGCTNLVSAPTLPARNLGNGCYSLMFAGCKSLTTPPTLPATDMAEQCYLSMFSNCTSLTTGPSLPGTTLATSCYQEMFLGCTSLVNPPALQATTAAESCYSGMFDGCTALVQGPALPATTLATNCYAEMFQDCTGLLDSPVLPALTLVTGCYDKMFINCSSLSGITCLATSISASNCTRGWVYGVSRNGTFTKNSSMSSWTTGDSGIPTRWTVVDAT